MKFYPNLSLAKRIAGDIGCDDPLEVHRAIQRRAPGVLFINARFDELSRDQYEDLCFAIGSELQRVRQPHLVKSTHGGFEIEGRRQHAPRLDQEVARFVWR